MLALSMPRHILFPQKQNQFNFIKRRKFFIHEKNAKLFYRADFQYICHHEVTDAKPNIYIGQGFIS